MSGSTGTAFASFLGPNTIIKVSSTLDKSVGKKYLIDNNPETCWTSQPGLPQYIQLTFIERVVPKRVSLTFQGGFVGTRCSVHVSYPLPQDSVTTKTRAWHLLKYIYPEDVNRRQSFDLYPPETGGIEMGVESLKLVFEQSSDFFGRITLYDIKLEGTLNT